MGVSNDIFLKAGKSEFRDNDGNTVLVVLIPCGLLLSVIILVIVCVNREKEYVVLTTIILIRGWVGQRCIVM